MPTVKLTPLGLGELLDQTFSTFRKHFWLFAGIMVVPQGIMVALNIVIQVTLRPVMYTQPQQNPQAAAQAAASAFRVLFAAFGTMIPYYIFYTLALGATTYALSEVYLGRNTTIREAYRVVGRKFWRLVGVIALVFLIVVVVGALATITFAFMVAALAVLPKSLAWLTIIVGLMLFLAMLISGVLFLIFLLRYSVAIPAVMLERVKAYRALKRSATLTKGFLWRLVLVGFLMTMIQVVVVGLCQTPFTIASFLVMVKGTAPSLWLTIPSLLLGGAASTATSPLLMISFAIVYYDLRVRKEGFDLQLMMEQMDSPQAAGETRGDDESGVQETSVLFAVAMTLITGGIYVPIWFLRRRKALNELRSPEKIGLPGLLIALIGFVGNFSIPIVGTLIWGSSVQAENNLGPLHPAVVLVAQIVIIVECFKVRRILLDHLAPQQEGMFSASIRFQYDDMLSRMGTFFLGIYYLQYKINGLLDRLAPTVAAPREAVRLAVAEPLPPPIIS